MVHIDWYGPPSGSQSVEHIVSYSVPVSSGLKRHASRLRMDAAAILAMTHHRPGEEHSSIKVGHDGEDIHGYVPDLDSIVYLEAPGADAAESIEFGHYTKPRMHEGEGPRTKADHRRHWVPGVAPLRKAARKMSANPKLSIK